MPVSYSPCTAFSGTAFSGFCRFWLPFQLPFLLPLPVAVWQVKIALWYDFARKYP